MTYKITRGNITVECNEIGEVIPLIDRLENQTTTKQQPTQESIHKTVKKNIDLKQNIKPRGPSYIKNWGLTDKQIEDLRNIYITSPPKQRRTNLEKYLPFKLDYYQLGNLITKHKFNRAAQIIGSGYYKPTPNQSNDSSTQKKDRLGFTQQDIERLRKIYHSTPKRKRKYKLLRQNSPIKLTKTQWANLITRYKFNSPTSQQRSINQQVITPETRRFPTINPIVRRYTENLKNICKAAIENQTPIEQSMVKHMFRKSQNPETDNFNRFTTNFMMISPIISEYFNIPDRWAIEGTEAGITIKYKPKTNGGN